MGRFMTDLHRRIKGKNLTVFASAARTATPTSSATIDTREANTLVVTLAATAKTGTSPTLDVKLQTSEDGSTWVDVASATFTQITSGTSLPSTETKIFNHIGSYCKFVSTIGGSATPGFTYSLLGYTK
jgi:hypothetical protein